MPRRAGHQATLARPVSVLSSSPVVSTEHPETTYGRLGPSPTLHVLNVYVLNILGRAATHVMRVLQRSKLVS